MTKVRLKLPAEVRELPQEQKAEILKSLADQMGVNTITSHNHERDMWTPDEVPMIAELEDWFYGELLAGLQTFYMRFTRVTGLKTESPSDVFKSFGDEFFDWIEKSEEGRKGFNLRDMIRMDQKNREKLINYVADGGVFSKEEITHLQSYLNATTPNFGELLEAYAVRAVLMGKIKNIADLNSLEMLGTLIQHLPVKLRQISDKIEPIQLTDPQGKKYVVQMHPLSDAEKEAIQYAEQNTAQYVTNATTRLKSGIQQVIVQSRRNRVPLKQVQQALLDKFGEANRDFRRIALTEITDAMANGYLASLKPGTRVVGQGAANACPHCKRLIIGHEYVYQDKPGDPGTTVWVGKTNVGNRAKDYVPTIPMHPHCRCRWVQVSDFQGVDKHTGAIYIKPLDELIEDYKRRGLIHQDYDMDKGGPKGDYSKL